MRRRNVTNAGNASTGTIEVGANAGRRVAVVGGGIGGLTAALAFARKGAKVTVYEQAPALTEVGAGLQITPNGAVALRALGLGPALDAGGVAAQAVVPTDGITGRPIARFDLTGRDYRFFHRADLIDALAAACAAAGVTVVLGRRIEDVARVPGDPVLVVGADGVKSRLRAALNPQDAPFFTGQVAWRCLVDAPHPPEARIWMLPGRHVVTYPLPGGRVNVVAVQERAAFAADGWHHADDPRAMMAAFADACPALRDFLAAATGVNLWGLFRYPVAACWQDGSVALLGDAAHPTLPFLAQGANLAIEDAYTLTLACDRDASLVKALLTYQATRRPRVVRAIEAANANARKYHLSGVSRRVAHAGLRAIGLVAPDAFLGRLSWLYDYDVTAP